MPTRTQLLHHIALHPEPDKKDVVYHHATMVQCFLPVRSLPRGTTSHQVRNGNSILAIDAGTLLHPQTHERIPMEVPSGSKARLLFAYINDLAIRSQSPEIDMGENLWRFMTQNGIPGGGRNAKEINRQVQNIAAAEILIGNWGSNFSTEERTRIARSVSFWLESDDRQTSMWSPVLRLSNDYLEKLEYHRVPLDFRVLVALQEAPRLMDVYSWLCYRLPKVKRVSGDRIPWSELHSIFMQGRGRPRDFKKNFKHWVYSVHDYYPEARLNLTEHPNYITLYPSPCAVPKKGLISIPNKAILPRSAA